MIADPCAETQVHNRRRAPRFGAVLANCATCGATVLMTRDGKRSRKHAAPEVQK